MDKIKILVACHKPGAVYSDDVYTPIHVGRAVSPFKDVMGNMIGDDTGDNLSEKNPMYCELTAQYWAWKNLKDVEYIGFCHYRRFFDFCINAQNVDDVFRKKDVILLDYPERSIIEKTLLRYVALEDVTIFLMVLKNKYPEYEQTTLDYLWGNQFYPNNMLICKKTLFDEYARWIFDILIECERYMKTSGYTRGMRTLAYLGEFFMPVYMLHHHYRIKGVKRTESYGGKAVSQRLIGRYLLKMHESMAKHFNRKPKCFEDYYFSSVLTGLKADGILDEMACRFREKGAHCG